MANFSTTFRDFTRIAVPYYRSEDRWVGRVLLASVIALLNDGARDWPSAIPVSGPVDTALLLRQFRMAAVWAGRCRPGAFRAGNGERSATVELDGEMAGLVLAVVVDAAGHLRQADLLLRP